MKQVITILLIAFAGVATAQPFTSVCRPPSNPIGDNKDITPHDKTIKCEDGPVQKIHTIRNYFFWPPIYKGTCDDLDCDDPPCIARKTVWKTACVLVYWIVDGCWRKIGHHHVRYLDHLSCSCKQCSDITNARTCAKTKPCPNVDNRKSFCYFSKERCDCCEPKGCPKGQKFDRRTCSCVCPKGSKEVKNQCVGDCKDISLNHCKNVYCEENPHFFCEVDKHSHKCVCPSCDDANSSQCPKTKCIELRGNPSCVFDKRARKCRCPECKDFKSKKKCVTSFCTFDDKCKWSRRKCFCPDDDDDHDDIHDYHDDNHDNHDDNHDNHDDGY